MGLNKIAIFLRKTWQINRFREVIISTFRCPLVSEMILCSGFFEERDYFQASSDFRYNCNGGQNLKILKLVGIYNYTWTSSYAQFYCNVRNNNCTCCVRVEKYRIPGTHWHAKIMIGKENNGRPIVAIIGSSNITRRAFGIHRKFNFESDVIFWDDTIDDIRRFINNSLENRESRYEVIVSDYNQEDRRNYSLSLDEKILKLERDIFEIARREL
jgi:phosphatidylserine/phosphatidylglycerophosphate/cardiolipin synthase-like enzyme